MVPLGLGRRPARARRVHARLIELRREHPVFRRPRSSRAAARRRRPPRRLVDAAGRAAHDAARLAPRRRAGDRRLPERRGDPDATPQGEPVVDDSFLLLFNGHYEPIEFKLPTKRFGTRWQFVLSTARARRRRRLAVVHRARGRCRSSRDRWSCCAAAGGGSPRRTGCSCGRGSASARRARSCRTCASSASRTSISRRSWRRGEGSTHGYDVVDPTRVSEQLGGEEAFRSSPAPGSASCSTSSRTTWPSSDENPLLGRPALRAAGVRLGSGDGLVSALLHDRRARRRARRGSRGLRAHAPQGARARRGRPRRRAAHRPSRRARRPARLPRAAAEGVEHVWVEKILEPGERLRDWPVEGTTGYEFANDVTALFVDPRGEEPLTRWYESAHGRRAIVAASLAEEAKLELGAVRPSARGRQVAVVCVMAMDIDRHHLEGRRRVARCLPNVRRAAHGSRRGRRP